MLNPMIPKERLFARIRAQRNHRIRYSRSQSCEHGVQFTTISNTVVQAQHTPFLCLFGPMHVALSADSCAISPREYVPVHCIGAWTHLTSNYIYRFTPYSMIATLPGGQGIWNPTEVQYRIHGMDVLEFGKRTLGKHDNPDHARTKEFSTG